MRNAVAEAAEEVTRQRDDEGCVIESSEAGFEVAKSRSAKFDGRGKVLGPGIKFVIWQGDKELPCTKRPTEHYLDLGRGAFGE
jgi:hypothetical protein